MEIKDVRVGQIRKMADGIFYIDDDHGDLCRIDEKKQFKGLIHNDEGQLIGKIGITHRIEDRKLVEIPRTAEFQTDDVIEVHWEYGIEIDVIRVNFMDGVFAYLDPDFIHKDQIKKVGILGVTHEFVNDREQSNDDR